MIAKQLHHPESKRDLDRSDSELSFRLLIVLIGK